MHRIKIQSAHGFQQQQWHFSCNADHHQIINRTGGKRPGERTFDRLRNIIFSFVFIKRLDFNDKKNFNIQQWIYIDLITYDLSVTINTDKFRNGSMFVQE